VLLGMKCDIWLSLVVYAEKKMEQLNAFIRSKQRGIGYKIKICKNFKTNI
jgi:hypothetical protein